MTQLLRKTLFLKAKIHNPLEITKQKKNTLTPMQQRERALGDYLDFYDYVERMLAASESGLLGEPEVDYNAVNEVKFPTHKFRRRPSCHSGRA